MKTLRLKGFSTPSPIPCVAIYAQIVSSECPRACSGFLNISEKAIPKSTLSQHFKSLREAGLIRGERRGVEMHNTSRCAELEKRFPGLLAAIVNAFRMQSQLKLGNYAAKRKTSNRSTRSK